MFALPDAPDICIFRVCERATAHTHTRVMYTYIKKSKTNQPTQLRYYTYHAAQATRPKNRSVFV